jgi:hypothetical protein
MGIKLDPNTSQLFLYGGHGGIGFSEHSRLDDNEVLVGLNVWSGVYIDSVQPLYSKVLPTGLGGSVREGKRYGGRGGEVTRIYRPNHVVTGLALRHGHIVEQLSLIWREWGSEGLQGEPVQSQALGGGGGGGRLVSVTTAEGEIAVGVFGASGWYVDRISLITCNYQLVP